MLSDQKYPAAITSNFKLHVAPLRRAHDRNLDQLQWERFLFKVSCHRNPILARHGTPPLLDPRANKRISSETFKSSHHGPNPQPNNRATLTFFTLQQQVH